MIIAGRILTAIVRRALIALCFFVSCMKLSAQVNTDNVTIMGRNALGAEDYVTAIHYFSQVIGAKPFLDKPYYYRAFAKYSLDDFGGAVADCSRSIEINPYQIEVYQLRGLCYSNLRKFDEAIADYSHILKENMTDMASRFNRGLCYLQLHRYDEAKADMRVLLKGRSSVARAYKVLIQANLEQGDTLTAMATADTLLMEVPADADGWALKGQYALQQQRYEEADTCMTKAINAQPNNHEYYLARALARNGYNRFGNAVADYDKVIALVPEHFVAHYNRGLIRALIGDRNRAIEDFTFILGKDPENTLARYNRALLRQQTGNYRGAVEDYSRLLREYPDFLYGYLSRAQCYRKLGNTREALNDESVVARANLDLSFNQRRRRPVKKVRLVSDRAFEHYDQLVEEDNDSTGSVFGRLFAADNFGAVQKHHTEVRLLPPFILTLRPKQAGRHYLPDPYLPEARTFGKKLSGNVVLRLTTESSQSDAMVPVVEPDTAVLHAPGERRLLRSVLLSDAYDYAEALEVLSSGAGEIAPEIRLLTALQTSALVLRQFGAQTAADDGKAALGKLQLADMELEQAARLSPGNVCVLYNRACLAAARGNSKGAIELLSEAIASDADFAEAYYNRGILCWQTGDRQQAMADFSQAGELGLFKAYNLLKQMLSEKK